MLEADVIKSIRKRLDHYQFFGQIEWYERIQSLKIQHHGHWIQGARKGTPDFLALMRGRSKELIAVFIEAKSTTGQLRPEQADFAEKYNRIKDIYVLKVTDPKQLDEFINKNSIDKTEDLPENIG